MKQMEGKGSKAARKGRAMSKVIGMMLVGLMAMASFADTVQTLDISASIMEGTSYLLINGGTLTIGSVQPSATNKYFVTDSREAEYFAANGPWHIKVSTDNIGNKLGMVNAATTNNIMLKIWQASMGPKPDPGTGSNGVAAAYAGKVYPDPDDNPLWWRNPADESTVCWAVVQDNDVSNMIDYTKIAWSAGSATFNPAPLESEVSPTSFRLAFETFGHKVATYNTMLTFELVIEP